VSYDALLIHHVEIRRRTGALDRFKQPIDTMPVVATIPGRIDVPSGGERFTERSRDVVIYSHKLFLPAGTELYEADRVTVRRSATGDVLCEDGEVTEVQVVDDSSGPHHVEAKLMCRKTGDPLHDPPSHG
jgi:hypothetical protein